MKLYEKNILEKIEESKSQTQEIQKPLLSRNKIKYFQTSLGSNSKKTISKCLAIASILIDPLYSYFLFTAIYSVIEYSQEEAGLNNKFWEILFTSLAAFFTIMNFISDITLVNPIEEAEVITSSIDENFEGDLNLIDSPPCKQKFVKSVVVFNQLTANSTYLINAGSSVLSVAYLTSLPELRWGIGLPVIILNVVYYNMLNRSKIKEHTYKFMKIILNLRDLNPTIIIKSPLKSLEVIIQILAKAIYSGISTGYVMKQILSEFIYKGEKQSSLSNDLILYAILTTFYNTIFSRSLNVQRKFFNSEFDDVSSNFLKEAKVGCFELLKDGIISATRSISASVLLFRHGPENFPLNITLTASLGILTMSHNFYVKYNNRLYEVALSLKKRNNSQIINIDKELSSEKLFDLIKEQLKTPKLKKIVSFINSGMILANWIAFLGFLMSLNEVLKANTNFKLDFYDLVCIQQLWGNTSLANDASFAQENMVENISYYCTKQFLEKNSKYFGLFHAFLKAKKDYPKNYLETFIKAREEIKSPSENTEFKNRSPQPMLTQFNNSISKERKIQVLHLDNSENRRIIPAVEHEESYSSNYEKIPLIRKSKSLS